MRAMRFHYGALALLLQGCTQAGLPSPPAYQEVVQVTGGGSYYVAAQPRYEYAHAAPTYWRRHNGMHR